MLGFRLFAAVIWALIIRKCVGFAKGASLSIVEQSNQTMIRSDHGLDSSLEHDLFGKPVSTFPDHALRTRNTEKQHGH
jgi:hypothetical protein